METVVKIAMPRRLKMYVVPVVDVRCLNLQEVGRMMK
jgi:hypothetical protein